MKKLTLFIALLFAVSLAYAQVPTIYNPNAKVTVTQQEIDSWRDNAVKAPASGVVTLTFEGVGNMVPIENYYNGGAGPNYGVSFSSNALALVAEYHGGSGNFNNEPSPYTIVFFTTGSPVMNVAAGFTTGFSFYYSSSEEITVFVYDGLDGTGTLLVAPLTYPANYQDGGCSGAGWCHWDPVGVAFAGTAKSIVFTGTGDHCVFDNVTFGSITPGPTAVPTLTEWGLIILGLTLLAFGTFYILKMRG